MRTALAILVGLGGLAAADTTTTPHPGMTLVHRKTATQDIHALVVDLCAPGIRVRATKHGERGRTVSSFGTLVGAEAAINGNFFNLTTFETTGPAMGNGGFWGGSDSSEVAPLQFGAFRVALPRGGSTAGIATWAKQVISGRPSLIVGGVVRDASGASTCDARNPRTGLGLSADRETLVLVAVDGRRTDAAGMTCNELGALLEGFGAADAINLDGGGSSTMWVAGTGVVNQPSDGAQRTVGNHLAIHATGTGDAPNCPRARYLATELAGDSALELIAGATTSVALEVHNDGNVAWDDTVALATQDPADRESAFADASWPAANRAALAPATEPDADARFAWTLTAPAVAEPTVFTETFQLVHDGAYFGPTHTIEIAVRPADTEPEPEPTGESGGCAAGPGDASALVIALGLGVRRRRRPRSKTI